MESAADYLSVPDRLVSNVLAIASTGVWSDTPVLPGNDARERAANSVRQLICAYGTDRAARAVAAAAVTSDVPLLAVIEQHRLSVASIGHANPTRATEHEWRWEVSHPRGRVWFGTTLMDVLTEASADIARGDVYPLGWVGGPGEG